MWGSELIRGWEYTGLHTRSRLCCPIGWGGDGETAVRVDGGPVQAAVANAVDCLVRFVV
jgi:hypothetical protein